MTKNTMRAISQNTLGEPDVLQEVELDRPEPGGGQILVAVHAAGVNPTDWMHRRLGLHLGEPPFTLGWDVSGVVEAVGLGVSLFQPGDEVFGMLPYPDGAGAYAEYLPRPRPPLRAQARLAQPHRGRRAADGGPGFLASAGRHRRRARRAAGAGPR